jgi:hypothetical protein
MIISLHDDDADNDDDNDDDGVIVNQVVNKVSQTQPAKAPPVASVVTPTIIEEDLFVSPLSIDEKVGDGYISLYRKTVQLSTI